MTTSVKTIALLLVLAFVFITPSASQRVQHSAASPTTSVGQPVTLHVTVTDRNGGFVAGLKASDFQISIDKKLAQIVSAEYADSPVSVGIVFDASASMLGGSKNNATRNFNILRQALRQFLEVSNQSNDYFLFGFNQKPQVLVDWTSDRASIIDGFNDFYLQGNTSLYDACYVAIDKLRSGRHAKRVLILISDGRDTDSQYSFNELRESLRETGVLLYSIYFPSDGDSQSFQGREGLVLLDELSLLNGGRAVVIRDRTPLKEEDATTRIENLAREIRSQYSLSIVPNETSTIKKLQKIKLKVKVPEGRSIQVKDIFVRTRAGLYNQ